MSESAGHESRKGTMTELKMVMEKVGGENTRGVQVEEEPLRVKGNTIIFQQQNGKDQMFCIVSSNVKVYYLVSVSSNPQSTVWLVAF